MEGKLFATTIKTLAPQFQCKSKPSIDNIVFKLHYKATVTVLIVFVLLACSRELFNWESHTCIPDFKDKDVNKAIRDVLFFHVDVYSSLFWRFGSFFLYRRSLKFNEMMFRHATGAKFNSNEIFSVTYGCQYSDWLFLYYLAKNMEGFVFRELFSGLAEELQLREDEQNEEKPALIDTVKYG